MLFDPTERNVGPFLFPAKIRTVKELVLALAIHDKNVTMAKPTQVAFVIWTGLTPHLKTAELPRLTETVKQSVTLF